jgi:hypothetical protein
MRRRCLAEGQRLGSLRQAPRGYSGLKTYRNNTLRECSGPLCLTSFILYSQPQITYIYSVQSSVRRLLNYLPPTPSPPIECVLPPHQRLGGTHSPGGEEVGGGGNILEDARHCIGLLQYNPSTVQIHGITKSQCYVT